MEGRRFDAFTRIVAADVSRRGVVRGALAALIGAVLGSAPSASTRAQGADLGCCRCTGPGSLPGCQSARDLGDCRQLCGRSVATFDPIATCSGDGKTCEGQVAAADDFGCCFCLKEPGRGRGCVNAKDLETCKVHCKKNPNDSDEALPPDADVDFNPNKICQPSEAGGKKYVCRTKAMSTADALQYDPIAFFANVALALPHYDATPIAYYLDPQQVVTDGHFLGADSPAGWQGLMRTVLYVPDPNAAEAQGISQALYLKGHWFDTDRNAQAWYQTGKPLVEASGNGSYVDQTGEADFGTARTVWGTSFSPADNADVTIHRGIAWFRVGHVVFDATHDLYCPSEAVSNTTATARMLRSSPLNTIANCDDETPAIGRLGELLGANLRGAETNQVVTRHLPILPGTSLVNVNVPRWADETTNEFGESADDRKRRESFAFGADGHFTANYAGVDADGSPVAVFTNSWFVETAEDAQVLSNELQTYVAGNDEQIGIKREEIQSVASSANGQNVTANAFALPQQDGSLLGGVEFRAQFDNIVATAAVLSATPLPAGTTPREVAESKQASLSGETRDALGAMLLFFFTRPEDGAFEPNLSPFGTQIDL